MPWPTRTWVQIRDQNPVECVPGIWVRPQWVPNEVFLHGVHTTCRLLYMTMSMYWENEIQARTNGQQVSPIAIRLRLAGWSLHMQHDTNDTKIYTYTRSLRSKFKMSSSKLRTPSAQWARLALLMVTNRFSGLSLPPVWDCLSPL